MTAQPAGEQPTVLIVEDDDGHAALIKGHLEKAGLVSPTIRFRDGEEAWNFLAQIGPPPHRRTGAAYLILLDIRMPRMDGTTLLRMLKSHEELRKVPVIMLTTTDDPREVAECYRLGCSAYIAKSLKSEAFSEALRRLGLFIQIVLVSPID